MKKFASRVRRYVLGGVAPRLHAHVQLMTALKARGRYRLARFVAQRIQLKYGVFISPSARIAPTVEFRHPVGIVIGDGVEIGDRSVIYQHVTFGGARIGDGKKNNYPKVGTDTVIFAGAVIVGGITIGNGCTIAANAVVLKDVPDGATAAGVPARIINANQQAVQSSSQ